MANALTKKAGPLPVWAWGILGGIAVYFLYTRYSSSSANSAANSPVATALDPNQVDPTTGLTYGQELAGSYPTAGGLQGAADSAGTSGQVAPDFVGWLNGLGDQLGAINALASQLGYAPPNPSDSTVAAASSPPIDNTTPVATTGPIAGNSITTHPGGSFYKYYQAVTGHAPPHTLKTSNAVYQMWQAGVKKPPTKNPSSHRAKTIFAANPQGHQHQVTKPKSTAKPQPVKHPAGGGNPGKVQSGSHQRVTGAGSAGAAILSRAPAHQPPPPHKPPPPKPKPRRR